MKAGVCYKLAAVICNATWACSSPAAWEPPNNSFSYLHVWVKMKIIQFLQVYSFQNTSLINRGSSEFEAQIGRNFPENCVFCLFVFFSRFSSKGNIENRKQKLWQFKSVPLRRAKKGSRETQWGGGGGRKGDEERGRESRGRWLSLRGVGGARGQGCLSVE